jgi:hypothetical protein
MIRACFDPPWAVRVEDRAPLTVMLVVRGEAWVLPDRGERTRLRAGDLAIARGPDPYTCADAPPHGTAGADPARPGVPLPRRTPPQRLHGPGRAHLGRPARRCHGDADRHVPDAGRDQRPAAGRAAAAARPHVRRVGQPAHAVRLRGDRAGRAGPGGRPGPSAGPAGHRRAARVVRPPRGGAPAGTGPSPTRWSASSCAPAPGRPRPPVDRRLARRQGRGVPRRTRPPFHRPGRRAPDDVPHRLAPRPRRRPPARLRGHARLGGPPGWGTAARSPCRRRSSGCTG